MAFSIQPFRGADFLTIENETGQPAHDLKKIHAAILANTAYDGYQVKSESSSYTVIFGRILNAEEAAKAANGEIEVRRPRYVRDPTAYSFHVVGRSGVIYATSDCSVCDPTTGQFICMALKGRQASKFKVRAPSESVPD